MSSPQHPVAPTPDTPLSASARSGNGFGVAALVLGIFAIVFAAVPFISYAAIGAGALAVLFGILGMLRRGRPHATSVTGAIIGAVALIVAIIMTVLYTAIFFGVAKAVHDEQKAATTTHTIVYSVTGAAQDADVTYSTYTNGSFGTSQSSSTPLPFTKTLTAKGDTSSFSFNSFTLSATNGANDTGAISCSITVDGKKVASQTSTGSFADVTCSGSN